jgi:hypothetical protein
MKFTINAETIVEGTPVGKNCPIPPTVEELDCVWRALCLVVKKLGKAADMVEILQVSFRQGLKVSDERFLAAYFKVVLVVPLTQPVRKVEATNPYLMSFLFQNANRAMEEFATRIRAEIRRAISDAEESIKRMSAMV